MLMGAAAGCGVGAEPPAMLVQITPALAYNDAPVAANIYGKAFRPAYQFDTTSGSASVDVGGFSATLVGSDSFALEDVTWESVGILSAFVPAGIPSGQYDLIVGDPRGHSTRLPQAFTSLGLDTTPPAVSISSPTDGSVSGANAPVNVIVAADDGYGLLTDLQVTITVGTGAPSPYPCSLTGGARTSCAFSVPAPAPTADGDMLFIDAQATGSGGLTQEASVSVLLLPAPVLTGLSPDAGSTRGGTAVTLSGADFVSGTTEVAFDGQVALLYGFTSTSITALAPPHAAGPVTVTVTTGGATATLAGAFTYLPPPTIREVSPTSGPTSGFTPITIVGENFRLSTTVITFDGKLLVCPTFVNANRIEGFTPPGLGSETIAASDALGGSLPGADVPFVYLAAGGDAGVDGAVTVAAPPLTPDGGCPGSGGP
jgi:IPT/TIG domain